MTVGQDRPRLEEHCVDCHMPKRASANLRVETVAGNVFPPLRDHYIRVDPPDQPAADQPDDDTKTDDCSIHARILSKSLLRCCGGLARQDLSANMTGSATPGPESSLVRLSHLSAACLRSTGRIMNDEEQETRHDPRCTDHGINRSRGGYSLA